MNFKLHLISFFILAAIIIPCVLFQGCSQTEKQVDEEKYEATWESLKFHSLPKWFDDSKFGIFIHWGIYSVPAYSTEWYPRFMYMEGHDIYKHHTEEYGPPWEFGYKDFLPHFTADKFDPDQWASLFRQAGARYVVPVGEHHDGFAMWNSDLTEWDAMDKGPRRDIIGELGEAVRKLGMKYAPSYHRAQLWKHYNTSYQLEHKCDTQNPEFAGEGKIYPEPHEPGDVQSKAFLDEWENRWKEIQEKYRPDLAWFDFGWGDTVFHPYMKRMMADYYNTAREWGKEVAFNNKTIRREPMAPPEVGDFIELDHLKMDSINKRKWQCPTYMGGGSWGYNKEAVAEDYKSADQLIDEFVDIVSKNGNLLLNVGPKADGTIPQIMIDRLLSIGEWLQVNGEAIFETRYWKIYGEDNVRYTRKGDKTVYAISMEWPGKQLRLKSFSNYKKLQIKSVSMLGIDNPLIWNISKDGLSIQCPEEKPCDHAFSFRIEMK
jgi:alpha-L-fucosidase